MKKSGFLLLAARMMFVAIVVVFLSSCIKGDEPDVRDVYMDIVSCHFQPDSSLYFEQILPYDKGSVMLHPVEAITANVYEEQRVMMQFYVNSLSEDKTSAVIEPIAFGSVRHDTIMEVHPDTIAAYPNDEIKFNGYERAGDYLDLSLELMYYNKPHRLDLFYAPEQTSPDTLNVILCHDDNGDLAYDWTTAYASFYVPNLKTYKAVRIYANMMANPLGYVVAKMQE